MQHLRIHPLEGSHLSAQLLVFIAVILLAAPALFAGIDPCVLPGLTVVTDPPGDQVGAEGGANTSLDIQELLIAEPFTTLADRSVTFTIKVTDLNGVGGNLPPNSIWRYNLQARDDNDVLRTIYVRMDTVQVTAATFTYGFYDPVSGTSFPQGTSANVTGSSTPSGTISIKVKTGVTLAFTGTPTGGTAISFSLTLNPGDLLSFTNISGEEAGLTQFRAGVPVGTGFVEPIDMTATTGSYTIQGNVFCAPNVAPVARLTGSPTSGTVPLNVTFDGSASSDPDFASLGDTIASYDLDFGDGTAHATGSGLPPNNIAHTYSTAGTFTASLSVVDSRGKPSLVTASSQQTIAVSPANTGQDFFTVTPCRLYDSRITDGALASGTARTLAIVGTCGIPTSAKAVSFNFTVVNSTGPGYVSFYPDAGSEPVPGTLHFKTGQSNANNQQLKLATSGTVGSIQARANLGGSGSTHIVVDVNGYFE